MYALVCLSRAPVFGNVFYMLIVTCYKHVVGANILSIQHRHPHRSVSEFMIPRNICQEATTRYTEYDDFI